MNFKRQCPNCNKDIFYKTFQSFDTAKNKNTMCKSCSSKIKHKNKEVRFKRQCPTCNNEIKYYEENTYLNAIKNNSKCRSCISKISQNRPEQKEKLKKASSGKNNPMYGKHFSTIWKEKYGEAIASEKCKEIYLKHSNRMKKNNPMVNRSILDIWIKKYGEDVAYKKHQEWKLNVARYGVKNGMYGKPSPIGSGNGWSGWYNGIYFRSLLELSYLKYLLDNNIKFENGEKNKHKIEYVVNGEVKNYFPDYYLVDTREVIEIKPKALIDSYINKEKFKAGRLKHGDKFKILTEINIPKLSCDEIVKLYKNNHIKFIDRYDLKFKNYLKGENKNASYIFKS